MSARQGTFQQQLTPTDIWLCQTLNPTNPLSFSLPGRPLLTAGVDHMEAAPIIGRQYYSWAPDAGGNEHFRWQVAPARLYAESTTVRCL